MKGMGVGEERAGAVGARVLPPPSADRGAESQVDEVDAARAQEYALLATLLARAPDAGLLGRVARLRGDPSPLGLAHPALAEAASCTNTAEVEREYFDPFIGLARGEPLP